ncbi:MAG TPA: poly-gamma-glutamate biosynthesis protein PgsC/CapC [Thermotogota bacterium]|nr:poly-gamma-glutamate biosynthesis protein PgsC/CapC [Thermotogota bacterium]
MILELSVIGIICSCIYILLFDTFPGGIIVPVYFSMYLFQPARIAGTLLISVPSVIILKLLSKKLLIFGRRRFVFLLILSAFLYLLLSFILDEFFSGLNAYQVIGLFIPGLLANNMYKQGIWKTLLSLLTVSVFIFFTFRLVYIL